MNVLVTGATGFIGSHLCQELLRRGAQVSALVRSPSACRHLEAQGVRLIAGDLTEVPLAASLAGEFEYVIHLAGLTKALRPRDLYQVNEAGTRSLLDCLARWPSPPTVVLVSSLAAVGPSGEIPHVECARANPVSNYGRSKRAGEVVAESFADRMPITIVRPPIVFGEGDRGTLPIFKAVSQTRVHAIPGLLPKWYSLIHVADLVPLLIVAANRGERLNGENGKGQPGQGIYFVNGGAPIRYGHLGQMIGQALGHRMTVRLPLPHAGVWAVGAITEAAGWIFGSATAMSIDKAREATAGSWTCSADKAERQLGHRANMSLAERIHQTAAWYRQHGWL